MGKLHRHGMFRAFLEQGNQNILEVASKGDWKGKGPIMNGFMYYAKKFIFDPFFDNLTFSLIIK